MRVAFQSFSARTTVAVTIAALAVTLASARPTAHAADEAPGPSDAIPACVSVLPQAFLVDRIGGSRVDVWTLTEAGQSPHSFEPTPALVARLSSTRVFFAIGLPFEETVLRDLREANPELLVIDSSAGITRRTLDEFAEGAPSHAGDPAARSDGSGRGDEHASDDRDTAHGHPDPHVWLSPDAAKIIATNIRDGLAGLDPVNAGHYDSNLSILVKELDRLDEEMSSLLAPYEGKSVYVFHPAFGYFAEAYGLRQIPIEVEGKEPGARGLAGVISSARAENVRAIFVQPQHPARIAETVAREIGADVVTIDPMGYDYFDMLRKMASAVAAALAEAGHGPEAEAGHGPEAEAGHGPEAEAGHGPEAESPTQVGGGAGQISRERPVSREAK